jgi:toxin HigB-1
MIESFRHKGLKRFYEKNDRGGLRPDLVARIRQILTALDAAETSEEMDLPTFRWHRLKGGRKGTFSVTVRANWRITFTFEEGNAYDVNFEDYH